MYYYANEIIEKIKAAHTVIIYGARIVAKEVATCLMGEPYKVKITCFMVTDKQNNPDELLGLPVVEFAEGCTKYQDALILVAVLEKYQKEILENLANAKLYNVIPLGFESDLWCDIRGNYFIELCRKENRSYLTLEEEVKKEESDLHIYVAKCHLDKKLINEYPDNRWEVPIQVGADLTDVRVCDVLDNTGDNISAKNKEYCELTALYWIWKNDHSKYVGLCHYRRHFCLDKETVISLINSDIDVVLTIPILNFPSVRSVYANDHIEEDWDIMLKAIKSIHPEYYITAETLQNGIFYYGYNMFIARKEIFDSYCEWLFPVLEYCEKYCGIKENKYQNRYIGFLAERLLSIYFLHNQDKWKIVHARKNFLS